MSKEAMKLALEALEAMQSYAAAERKGLRICDEAIATLEAELAKPDFWEGYVPEPVKPAQQEPVAKDWRHVIPGRRRTDQWDSARVADYNQGWNDCQKKTKAELEKLYTTPQAQPAREPVAWGWAIMHSDGTYAWIRPRIADFFGSIQEREPYTSEDAKHADREWAGLAPHTIVALYTSPPAQQEPVAWLEILRNNKTATDEVIGAFLRGHAEHLTRETFVLSTPAAPQPAQRTWVGLTDEEVLQIRENLQAMEGISLLDSLTKAIEAKLRSKNEDRN